MVEPGELPVQGAVRELWEEAQVRVVLPETAQAIYVNEDPERRFKFYTFAAWIDYIPQVTINEESLGFGWFRLTDLPRPLHPGFQELMSSTVGNVLRNTL